MNQRARDMLVKAALDGVPQTIGAFAREVEEGSGKIAYCAAGILGAGIFGVGGILGFPDGIGAAALDLGLDFNTRCPVEGCNAPGTAPSILIHLNDRHGWDFLTIARKFPGRPEETP